MGVLLLEATCTDPKWYQLRAVLAEHLKALPEGASLPSERALALEYQVSRNTVRQAISDLAAAGLVSRMRGSGTYPGEKKIELPLGSVDLELEAADPFAPVTSQVRSLRRVRASAATAAALHVAAGQSVWRLERLWAAHGAPLAVECTLLPAGRFPDLNKLVKDSVCVHQVLRDSYGCAIVRSLQVIETQTADPAQARLLQSSSAVPVLTLTRTTYDDAGTPVELATITCRGDRVRLRTALAHG